MTTTDINEEEIFENWKKLTLARNKIIQVNEKLKLEPEIFGTVMKELDSSIKLMKEVKVFLIE